MKKKWISLTVVLMAVMLTLSSATAKYTDRVGLTAYASSIYDTPQLEAYAQEVAVIVNRERAAQGLDPLKLSEKLSKTANLRAKEIQTVFAHTRPNDTACFTAMDEAGISYYYAAENIAYGQRNPEHVMNAWMNSTGHRNNILSESPQYIGVGVTCKDGVYYWVQMFALSYDLDGTIPVTPDTMAHIKTQPKDVAAPEGSTVSFQVEGEGSNLTYQWQISDDGGKTWRSSSVKTPTYTTTLTQSNNGRQMRCIVTNQYGNSATSQAASMKIAAALKITEQPKTAVVLMGAQATFTIKASGEGLSYLWQTSSDAGQTWTDSNVTNRTYITVLTSRNNGLRLRCVVTDKYGNKVTSSTAVMWQSGLRITEQPKTVVVLKGAMASFRVKATGDGVTYRWQISDDGGKTWRNSAVTANAYGTTLTSANNGRRMRCVVSDKYGNQITSGAAAMWMSGLKITAQPTGVTAKSGDSVQFTVKAAGDGLSYQWQISDDGGKIWRASAVKAATYYTTLGSGNNGRQMRCVVSDKYGNRVTSQAAVMTIAK